MQSEKLKCSTPLYVKMDICSSCGLRAEKEESGKKYNQYHPTKTKFNGWKCDMHEHKNQGNLFN